MPFRRRSFLVNEGEAQKGSARALRMVAQTVLLERGMDGTKASLPARSFSR
jgi:hypothetical protein